mgnify:CR=1 FL=1
MADAINNADGAAANMSETMMDNLQGSITLLQSAVDGVKISFGERLWSLSQARRRVSQSA